MNYIRRHWRGEQSVAWSLAVNLVLVRMVILYCDRYTLPPYITERPDAIFTTAIYIGICHGLIYPWQVIGLLRASERPGGIHSGVWTWASYLGITASLAFTLLAVFSAWQSLSAEKFKLDNPLALEQARAAQYELSLESTQTGTPARIRIKGIMALGITDSLRAMLDRAPDVTEIVLESDGGQVYEGRGVARLIRQRNLQTRVLATCSSACATAFIGGVWRTLGPDAKLGFHQYGLELWYPVPLFDLKREQQTELAFYRQQNISENFLSRVFRSEHGDIWFPDHRELLAAGVVHHIAGNADN